MPKTIQKALVISFLFLCGLTVYGQSDSLCLPVPSNNATLVGFGAMELYDTYLSPLKYKGTSFRLINERMKQMPWFDNKFVRQQTMGIELAQAENPAKNTTEYWLLFDYNWGGHYNVLKTDKFRFSAGAIWNTSIGVLYNERNGNNPASAKAYSNINLSVIGFYRLKDITFRWQMDTPVAGVLFSPHFGQSYYEMSLGNTVGAANFASLHNQRALRNYFTIDFPVEKFTFRLGYLGSYYQTKVHSLQSHNYSNSIVIGLVAESINFSGKKLKRNKQIKSSYY
ncbi:DUF3316 domain-containing protein [Viscerimonas tarda]